MTPTDYPELGPDPMMFDPYQGGAGQEMDPEIVDMPGPQEPLELFEQLSLRELKRLGRQVQEDFEAALMGHGDRMRRFARYYQLWRNTADGPIDDDDEPRYRVPLVQSDVYIKLAQNMDSLFGDDAEITAEPVGPSDSGTARKVGAFMSWRTFADMKLVTPFTIFEFRKLLYGRSHAYCPWERKYYWVSEKDPITGGRAHRQVLCYEGPGFYPLLPDDILMPAERVQSVQDFSFVIRKFRASPQQLLDGEGQGLYFGISENWDKICSSTTLDRQINTRGDEMKMEEQFLDGVSYDSVSSGGERSGQLTIHEWYGYWRLPTDLSSDVENNQWKLRDRVQSDLRVYYIPEMELVIGVDDLAELYPHTPHRRPFKESSMVKDGTYWPMGLGEMLEGIEDEASHVHRIFMRSGEMTAGPLIIARPGSGLKRGETRYKPWTVLWSDEPGGVNMLQPRMDHNWAIAMGQSLNGFAEKTTGLTDQNAGRSIDRPNAPRTASGQLALIEQGNIRASIDTRSLREDFSEVVAWFWTLETMFGSADTFFRVTEEDAGGLYDVKQGGAQLTDNERSGRYDFKVKLATSYWSREAKKERFLQLYGMLSQNPLVASNPAALGQITRELCKQLGHPDIAALVPMPSQIDVPRTPAEEWTLMLEGREANPHQQDNDQMHMVDHQKQLEMAMQAKEQDPEAMMMLQDHMQKTEEQMQKKMQMQAMAAAVLQQAQLSGQIPGQPGQQEQLGGQIPGQQGQ